MVDDRHLDPDAGRQVVQVEHGIRVAQVPRRKRAVAERRALEREVAPIPADAVEPDIREVLAERRRAVERDDRSGHGAGVRRVTQVAVRVDVTLLEAKDGYAGLHFAEHTDRFREISASLIQQAERQLRVLPGDAVLEWHVSNPHGAAAIERLLVDNNITDITVIYTPRR